MTDILSIGSSGVSAYQKQLEVTGNNIVNVNTDGYVRRDAQFVTAGQGNNIMTMNAGSGSGVIVDMVRRASNPFLQTEAQTAVSLDGRAQTLADNLSRLEKSLLTGSTNISTTVQNFFNNLQDVSNNPNSIPSRATLIEAGQSVASQFHTQANLLENELQSTVKDVKSTLDQVNALTQSIAQLNSNIERGSAGKQKSNDLLDQRDKVLGQLTKLVGVTITENPNGTIDLALGASSSGPALVKGSVAKSLTAVEDGNNISIVFDQTGLNTPTDQLTNGSIAGTLAYHDQVRSTLHEFNRLAQGLAQAINAQHQQGVDINGKPGGQVFSTSGFVTTDATTNRGSGVIHVASSATGSTTSGYQASYDSQSRAWTVTSLTTQKSVTSSGSITLDGNVFSFSGTPAGGDSFKITPSESSAADIQFQLTDPASIAVSLPRYADQTLSNTGTGLLSLDTLNGSSAAPSTAQIQDIFSHSLSPLSALGVKANGTVALIASGTQQANLSALHNISAATFSLNIKDLSATDKTQLQLGLNDGTNINLDLTLQAGGSLSSLADAMNQSLNASTTPDQIRGNFYASVSDGKITINALTSNFITSATVSGADPTTGTTTYSAAGSIETPTNSGAVQIFTREGRQLSGPALTADEAKKLLTVANGFLASAVYQPPSQTAGYRGLSINNAESLLSSSGDQSSQTIHINAYPETNSAQLSAAGAPLAGAVYALKIAGLPSIQLAGDDIAGKNASAVTSKLQDAANQFASTRSVLGGVINLPFGANASALNSTFTMSVNGQDQQITFNQSLSSTGEPTLGGTFTVSGPLKINASLVDNTDSAGNVIGQQTADGKLVFQDTNGKYVYKAAGGNFQELDAQGAYQDLSPGTDTTGFTAVGQKRIVFSLPPELASATPSISITGADTTSLGLGAASLSYTISAAAAPVYDANSVPLHTSATFQVQDKNGIGAAYNINVSITDGVVTITDPDTAGAPIDANITGSLNAQGRLTLSSKDSQFNFLSTTTASRDEAAKVGFLGTDLTVSRSYSLASDVPVSADALASTSNVIRIQDGAGTRNLNIAFVGGQVTVTDADANGTPVDANVTAHLDAQNHLILTSTDPSFTVLTDTPAHVATNSALGFSGSNLTMAGSDSNLKISSAISAGQSDLVDTSKSVSRIAQNTNISSEVPEDLLVTMTGLSSADRGSLIASYPTSVTRQDPVIPDVTVRIISPASGDTPGQLEIFDSVSKKSLATRAYTSGQPVEYLGLSFHVTGDPSANDEFTITADTTRSGDNRNGILLAGLANSDLFGAQSGSFQDNYTTAASQLGSATQAAVDNASATKQLMSGLTAAYDSVTGVSLDTEAADLLRYQQAYQASAQVIQTARTMFDTILKTF